MITNLRPDNVSNDCFNVYYMKSGDWLQCDLEFDFELERVYFLFYKTY